MDLVPTPEDLRRLGYAVVDAVVEHERSLRDAPVTAHASPDDLADLLAEALPNDGAPVDEVLGTIRDRVFARSMYPPHPRFFGYVPGPGGAIGAMADALVSGHNAWAASWLEASGPTAIEQVTMRWLCERLGLPNGAGGIFTSGGAVANLTAVVLARDARAAGARDRNATAMIYASERTHCTIERACRILGIAADRIATIPIDAHGRIEVSALAARMNEDGRHGRESMLVVANAGTVSTGAVDDLGAIADLCGEGGAWLHVDAAFGGAVCFSRRHAGVIAGIERADSITLDPHKWLFQPFGIGALLVRDAAALDRSFGLGDDYLSELETKAGEVNLFERGIEMTRPFRALKLWMTIKLVGADAIGAAVDRGIAHAEHAERLFAARPGWRVASPASLGIVAFRFEPDGVDPARRDALNRAVVTALTRDGFALVTAATIDGATVLRMCTINQRTTTADVEATADKLDELARALL